jgi:predicted ArsR family transcriptional regulator
VALPRDKPFLATTKGRLLELLRGAPATVEELSSGLGITGPAVRAHLESLEGDGFVRPGPPRRTSARRPSRTYVLAPGAESLFCQGTVPFLERILDALGGTLDENDVERIVRAAGRSLAGRRASGSLAARVAAAAEVLDGLGGRIEVRTRRNGAITYEIVGLSCPLGAVARAHPAVGTALQSRVAETVGVPARQRCAQVDEQPHCLFEVTVPVSRRAR